MVYSRFGIPLMSINTLHDLFIEEVPPLIYSAPGGFYVRLDKEVLARLRQGGRSLGELAEIAGVSRRTIQMYEEGIVDVNNPSSILHYAPSTIKQKKKRAKFKRTDHITLKDQGDFHKKMKLKIEPDQFIITSTDDKWPKFSSGDWGEGRFKNALGLTEKSKEELRKLVKSDLIIGFKNAIQNV